MRGLRGLVACTALACALIPAATAAADPVEPLGNSGRWITDAQGRVVVLHGVNLVTKRAPHLPSEVGFGPDDAGYLASEGFNSVRLGFGYEAIEPAPGDYEQDFLDAYAAEAQAVADEGLFVLADVHQDLFAQEFNGNGFPNWMALDDGEPNNGLGFPFGYFTNEALHHAFDNFWANTDAGDGMGVQDHYLEGLSRLADALEGNTGLLGYDVFNEPWPGTPWAGCYLPDGCTEPTGFDATLLTGFSERAVDAIREHDERHLAFYEPNLGFDFGAPTGHRDVTDSRTGMSFHTYCLFGTPDGDPAGCGDEEEKTFDNADAHAGATGNALLMTEFGATNQPASMERLAAAADRHMVGWNYWTYSNVFAGNDFPGTSLIEDLDQPPTPDNIKQPAMDALARPYPQVVAGTPRSWRWDVATRQFHLGYSTLAPNGRSFAGSRAETEIFMPARHFGGGYSVFAENARVVSEPGARVLRVESCPGATQVRVVAGNLPAPGGEADDPRSCESRCPTVVRLPKGAKGNSLTGGPAGERFVGNTFDNRLRGRGGDDCLAGMGGDDRLKGGPGDDVLKGGRGRDKISCGLGRDRAFVGRGDRVSRNCESIRSGKKGEGK